jgi:hypothetical protein
LGAEDDVVTNKGELVLDADRDAPNKDEPEPAAAETEVVADEAVPNKENPELAEPNRDEPEVGADVETDPNGEGAEVAEEEDGAVPPNKEAAEVEAELKGKEKEEAEEEEEEVEDPNPNGEEEVAVADPNDNPEKCGLERENAGVDCEEEEAMKIQMRSPT